MSKKMPSQEEISQQARFIIERKSTVRDAADYFQISKSTVHINCTERLQKYDQKLYKKVREVLDNNLFERNVRGGQATKKMWENKT